MLLLLLVVLPVVLVAVTIHKTRRLTSLPRSFLIWAAIGFFVPLYWLILGFLMFNAQDSFWTDFYWRALHITCPSSLITDNSFRWWEMIVNACLYGGIALIIMSGSKFMRRIASEDTKI
jgi:hypothetical protein